MKFAADRIRAGLAIAAASLLAGCVEPAYVSPGPVQLQPYPPPVAYQGTPDYRPPVSGPIPLQAAPLVQPLPPPTPAPSVTEISPSDTGAIPVQDMPAPVTDTSPAPTDATADTAGTPAATQPAPAPAQLVRKTPTTGPGSNVPLEGFRPMHGVSRPTP